MKTLIEKLEWLLGLGGTKRDIVFLCVSGAALVLSLLQVQPFPFDIAWVAIILCGVPIYSRGGDRPCDGVRHQGRRARFARADRLGLHRRGFRRGRGRVHHADRPALLEDLTVAKARAGIEKLVHLTPQTARLLTDGGETIVPAEHVKIGDRLRVLPGARRPGGTA